MGRGESNQFYGGGQWDDYESQQGAEDEEEDFGGRSYAAQDEGSATSSHDEGERDDDSDEFTLKRRTRQRKAAAQEQAETKHTTSGSSNMLNTVDGTLQRRFVANVLNEMFKRKHYSFAAWFTEPVDPILVPDYLSVIAEPMDLSTIKKKWQQGVYDKSIGLFESDILLMLKNCYAYNGVGSEVSEAGKKLENLFEDQMSRRDLFFEDPTAPEFASTSSDPKTNRLKPKPGPASTNKPASSSAMKQGGITRFDWDNAIKACEQCGTKTSPEWRRVVMDETGPNGEEVVKLLCNACGLRIVRARRKAAQSTRKNKPGASHGTASPATTHYSAPAPASYSPAVPPPIMTGAQVPRDMTPNSVERKVKKPRLSPPPPPILDDLGDRKAKKAASVAVGNAEKTRIISGSDGRPLSSTRRERQDYDYGSGTETDAADSAQRQFSGSKTRLTAPAARKGSDGSRRMVVERPMQENDGGNPRLPKVVVRRGAQEFGGAPQQQQMANRKRKLDSLEDSMVEMDSGLDEIGPGAISGDIGVRLRELERQNLQMARERSEILRNLDERTRSSNALRDEVTILGAELAEKTLQLDQIKRELKDGLGADQVLSGADDLAARLALVAEISTQRQLEDKLFEEFEAKYGAELGALRERAKTLEEENKAYERQANETKVRLEEATAAADQYRREVEVLSVDVQAGGAAAASVKLIDMLRKEKFEAATEAETLRAALKEMTEEVAGLREKLKGRPVAQPAAARVSANAPEEYRDILEQHESIVEEWKEAKAQLENTEADRERLKGLLRTKMTENEELLRQLKDRDIEKANLEREIARQSGKLDTIRSNLAAIRGTGAGASAPGDEDHAGMVEQTSADTLGAAASLEALVDLDMEFA